ncbi:putative quinol monooxygenase [Hyphomonas sp.]|uniref:putative quinol monooxygenase n=1 Tax=Hyphomonas sp. TaxID=87 RepID=UPI0035271146
MIIVTGSVRTQPDTEAELIALCREHCARSRAEDGCIAHNVHSDCDDPALLVFVEYWRDMEALKAHFALKESREFVKTARRLSAGGAPMRIFEAEEVKAEA